MLLSGLAEWGVNKYYNIFIEYGADIAQGCEFTPDDKSAGNAKPSKLQSARVLMGIWGREGGPTVAGDV